MKKNGKKSRKKSCAPRTKLQLPDLDQAKTAVLLTLRSPESQRGYRHAIDEFISWYCSEPRVSFNKTVVTRYKGFLEDRQLASGTINVRLAAVRRLAYMAADAGLLSPELAAGIRRVKGAKKLGIRLGNWLTADEAQSLLHLPALDTIAGKRDRAILGIMLGCGLRRRELSELTLNHLQRRENHWAIVDMTGKGEHFRTVPVPDWVKQAVDDWLAAAGIINGNLFRCGARSGKVWGFSPRFRIGRSNCRFVPALGALPDADPVILPSRSIQARALRRRTTRELRNGFLFQGLSPLTFLLDFVASNCDSIEFLRTAAHHKAFHHSTRRCLGSKYMR